MEKRKDFGIKGWDETPDSFDELGLKPQLLRGIYGYGFEKPTALQQKVILSALSGRDIIVHAASGCGKTSSYVIGVLELIDTSINQSQALILVPTRENALSISHMFSQIGHHLGVISHCCTGEHRVGEFINNTQEVGHVVVGTCGRILDALNTKIYLTEYIKICILEETDEIISRGFRDQIFDIFKILSGGIQTCLFSATMDKKLIKLRKHLLNKPIRIQDINQEFNQSMAVHFYIPVEKEELKFSVLFELFQKLEIPRTAIFMNNRLSVETLAKQFSDLDFKVFCVFAEIEKDEMTSKFIVNFDIPTYFSDYIERIGGCSRLYRSRAVVSLLTYDNAQLIKDFEEYYCIHIEELSNDRSELIRILNKVRSVCNKFLKKRKHG